MPRHNRTLPHQPFRFNVICKQKRRFLNEKSAREAAEEQMLIHSLLDLTVYKCTSCGGWHLTRHQRPSI